MKHLVEYIINETHISNQTEYDNNCLKLSLFSINKSVENCVDELTSNELKQIYDFFPSQDEDGICWVDESYNDPSIKIFLTPEETNGEHSSKIIKFNDKGKYWCLLSGEDDYFACKQEENKYFDSQEFGVEPEGNNPNKYGFYNGDETNKYAFYFKSLEDLFEQITNKAIEVSSNKNKIENELVNYVRPENFWNALLKKYSINKNTDVIVNFYDRLKDKDKKVREENWGKFDISLFDKFAKEDRSHRYSDIYVEFADKNITELYDFWYNTKSKHDKMNLYYGNGVVD